jgi:hypothetical protein
MSQHRPDLGNILATIRAFLDSCAPHLHGEMRYHAQVSSYLLAISERELRLGPGYEATERGQLAALLGHDAPTERLNGELAAGLRGGRFDTRFAEVLETLLALTADKVAVVRPDHLDPRHRAPLEFGTDG